MEYDFSDDSGIDRFVSNRPRKAARSITSLTREERRRITERMRQAISDLDRFYTVEKASLALFDATGERLCITHLYFHGAFKTSLTLVLPDQHSLLHQIHDQGFPVADNYPSLLTGSVIERKILMGPETRSVLVAPLVHDGAKLGLLSLASVKEAAFGPYLDGIGENIVNRFAAGLARLLSTATAVE